MDIFSVITLLGGLAFFLYGMNVMSDGLEKVSNGKLTEGLTKVTKNRYLAMVFGALMTIAVQSSSAVTVMLVGLVNSGILQFGQTIGVLMGSNIGTTLTAWILSLAGIDSDVVWLNLLKPSNFSPLFAFIGILMIMIAKSQRKKDVGTIMLGFAILMFGMTLMSDSMKPLAAMPEFASLLTAFSNPIIAVIIGAVFTGVIQSSAASVAILQALSMTGGVTYGMAIPIIMGQNIGTCVTAVISSIGVSRNAKKVAVVHLSFNIIGTMVCLIPFLLGDMIFDWAFTDAKITPLMIAIVHSIFNVVTTFLLLPFAPQLEKLANKIIPEIEEEEEREVFLDERILSVPSMAVNKSFDVAVDMFKLASGQFKTAIGHLYAYTDEVAEEISAMEDRVDKLEDEIGTYMMKVSNAGISERDSRRVAKILHTIDDFERIADHGVNIIESAKELKEKEVYDCFSEGAKTDLDVLFDAVFEIIDMTTTAYETSDTKLATYVEPLEQVIDGLILKIKKRHISRLQCGECTMKMGFALNDILTSCERVSDHCSNIAVAIIEAQHGTFDVHEYLHQIKSSENEEYSVKFDEYRKKFTLN